MSDVALLASARAVAKTMDPTSTIRRGPKRSDRFPQMMLPNAMARKPNVMALDTPVMDHPVSREMGRRKTGSENMAPIATQPKRPPAATITHRYRDSLIALTYQLVCITVKGATANQGAANRQGRRARPG